MLCVFRQAHGCFHRSFPLQSSCGFTSHSRQIRWVSSSPLGKMRAALVREFGGPEKIGIESNVAVPSLNDNEVLIKVAVAGVNPVDTYLRSGVYPVLPQLPYIPGREGAGVVEKVGGSVANFKTGDRVWFTSNNGASAEFAAVPEHTVFVLPENVDFTHGASIGIAYLTAYRALFQKAHAQQGQTCLIHGVSGGVGLATAQLAKAHGLAVYGTASTPKGTELAKASGCADVFNHHDADYVDKLKRAHPKGFDVIVEMLANVNLAKDLELIAFGGTIVVVGNRGSVEINPRNAMSKEATIVATSLFNSTKEDFERVGERLAKLLADGHLHPVVGREYQLDQLAEAHKQILEPGAAGKIVLHI